MAVGLGEDDGEELGDGLALVVLGDGLGLGEVVVTLGLGLGDGLPLGVGPHVQLAEPSGAKSISMCAPSAQLIAVGLAGVAARA